MGKRILHAAVTVALIAASIFIALPVAALGVMGLSGTGQLEDIPADEIKPLGWAALGAAIVIWAATVSWLDGSAFRWRFSLRSLLIATMAVAAVLGLSIYMIRK
jgi:hypothetical protein